MMDADDTVLDGGAPTPPSTEADVLAKVAAKTADRESRQARRMALLNITDAKKYAGRAGAYMTQAGDDESARVLWDVVARLQTIADAIGRE